MEALLSKKPDMIAVIHDLGGYAKEVYLLEICLMMSDALVVGISVSCISETET